MRPFKVKVAHIVTLLELGGAQQNTLHTVRHLDRERFEPIMLAGRGAYLDAEAVQTGAPVIFLKNLVRPLAPLRDFLAIFEIYSVLRRENPHIVHTHSSKAGILGRWAARLAGVPVIIHTFHGFGFNPEQGFLLRALYVFLEKVTAPFSRALIAVSKANQKEALSLKIGRPEQYFLVRSGVSLAKYKAIVRTKGPLPGVPLKEEHRLVATIGPFKPQKNLIDFILAASLVHARHPLARFLVVGDGALRPALEAEIAKRNLKNVFFLPGWRRDIAGILARTEVFAMTSLWEGLPRSLVEAMAAGLPSVANAIDGVTDVLEDGVTGFLTPPKSPEQTADRISYLLAHENEASLMGEKARSSIGMEFDIDEMVRRQEEIYENFLK